jgi:hypothetical protein
MRIAHPAKHFGLQEALGNSVTGWNETHRSLVVNMRILHWNEDPDLTRYLLALESEPIRDLEILPASESELLDRRAPDWQWRRHDGAVIDPILEVIHKPRKPSRSRASLSNPPRRLRAGVRQKTTLKLPRPLNSSGLRKFSSDQGRRLA